LLSLVVGGYEAKAYEITWAEQLLLSAERFLEATYGEVGKPRTGFAPSTQARVGSDNADRHCVCSCHEPDD